jgi:hypothetical protein
MYEPASGKGAGDGDVAAPGVYYTVVEMARGYLYLILIPGSGKLLYDTRTLAPTENDAHEALRVSLGKERFRQLAYVPPAEMLERVIGVWVAREAG